MTKDGALSLPEFKIAMHLVVLRKNNIRLTDTLPQSLIDTVPIATRNIDAVNANVDATVPSGTGASSIPSPTLSNTESLISPQQLKGGKEVTNSLYSFIFCRVSSFNFHFFSFSRSGPNSSIRQRVHYLHLGQNR